MEEAMTDGGTTGGSKTGAAMPADTEGAGEAKTSGTTDGGIKTGTGTVTIKQANGTLPRYNISYRQTNDPINVTYATNQPKDTGTSTSGIERFAIAEYKSQN